MERGSNSERGQELLKNSPVLMSFLAEDITPETYRAIGGYKQAQPGSEKLIHTTALFAEMSHIYPSKDHREVIKMQELIYFIGHELKELRNVVLFLQEIKTKLKKLGLDTSSETKRAESHTVVVATLWAGTQATRKPDNRDLKSEVPEAFHDFIEGLDI